MDDAEVQCLIEVFRSGPSSEIDATIQRLVDLGLTALPGLTECLGEMPIDSLCAEVLVRMPPSAAIPVLTGAIDRAPSSRSRERLSKAHLVVSLGRIGSNETVPYLEALYDREQDKIDLVALNIAWALQHITGRVYGPAANIQDGCRQVVIPAAP